MTAYVAKIYEAARAVPSADEIATLGEENFAALVSVLINTFDGAAMFGHVFDASRDRVAADSGVDGAAQRRAPITPSWQTSSLDCICRFG